MNGGEVFGGLENRGLEGRDSEEETDLLARSRKKVRIRMKDNGGKDDTNAASKFRKLKQKQRSLLWD
ncbi:hypothetical protein K1719_002695 [Acacia pycnantha]|nr:hypothetical protein K1719_002695 [Acacia pycnantha]